MKKETVVKLIVLAGVMAVFIFFALSLRKSAEFTDVGDAAYNFKLEDIDGKMQQLSDYKGQVVVLNYFATWCKPCVEEAGDLEAFEKDYGDQYKLLIINRGETRDRVKKFVEKYKTTSTYLFDYNQKVSKQYNVVAQPETFVIDKKGIIKEHYIGPITENELYNLVSKYQ